MNAPAHSIESDHRSDVIQDSRFTIHESRITNQQSQIKNRALQACFYVLTPLLLLLYVSPAFCTAVVDSTETFAWSQPSWGHLVKMVFLLLLVIVLIWVCLGLLKRALGLRSGGNNGVIMAGGVPLGQRRSIQFIKIGRTLYLVGVTDHNIGLIDAIKDEDAIEDIVNIHTSSGNQLFSTLLKKVSSKLSHQNAN